MFYTEKRETSIIRLYQSDCEHLQLKNICKIAHKIGEYLLFLCVSFGGLFIFFSRKFVPLFNRYKKPHKSDPIWLIYSRAYKQHYAWYLKKKMSQSEFQKWADYALELRQHALDWVLDLEEYRRIIRE